MIDALRNLARRFLLVTIIFIGAVCGLIAVLFHHYVELARSVLIGRALAQHGLARSALIVLVPTVVFALLALVLQRIAPRAVGANLARVRMAYSTDPSLLGPRSVAATFLATPISLGAGAPLGPEGPIVVVASGASAAIARFLRMPRKLVRGMIPVGTAAGIAAIFNTPITAVVFALEEVLGSAERGLLGGVIVGAVAAAVVERSLLGGRPLLAAPFATWSDPRELAGFALVGVIAGVVSGNAISVMHRLKVWWSARVQSMVVRAAIAGALVGALGLIAPSILGVGYESVSLWLHGGGTASASAIAFGVKTLAFVIAISSGVLGGTFAPSLFMGAALGSAIGHGAHLLFPSAPIDPKAYALLGMGSFFAGLLRSPIAAVLIVVELTRDYDLIVPLMLAVSLSVAISRRISHMSIVERQMADEGYVERRERTDPLSGVRVAQTMGRDPITLAEEMTIADACALVEGARHRVFPVIDAHGRLTGVVHRDALQSGTGDIVRTIAEMPRLIVFENDLVLDVVRRMQREGIDRCPVVENEESMRVTGFLSPSDILRARMTTESPAAETPFEIFD
ncbi:MAG TPA: chloride channel protein [Thermoanaerobaculia bacterium]|nr:chloride channel protein [Thermoanaerobaculia bacterium]